MFLKKDAHPAQDHYLKQRRHWCPRSEMYTGADSLFTLMREGWRLSDTVYQEKVALSATRTVTVYHFELSRGERGHVLSIINNPTVERLLLQRGLNVYIYAEETPSAMDETALTIAAAS